MSGDLVRHCRVAVSGLVSKVLKRRKKVVEAAALAKKKSDNGEFNCKTGGSTHSVAAVVVCCR